MSPSSPFRSRRARGSERGSDRPRQARCPLIRGLGPSRQSPRWHPGRLVHHWSVITSASFPPDLGSWNQDEHPYYLEVFGEVEPALDVAHAEVIPAGGSDAATTNATPIYEYWWTIGHGGSKPEHRHLLGGRAKLDLWRRLEDVAARVYLYFPISGG